MNIQAATLAGGSNNQDRYIIGDGFAAVLDGATSVAGDRSHDPGWFAGELAHAIGNAVLRGEPLPDAVADAIRTVRDIHGLTPTSTPTSTIALARWTADVIETYVLGDSYVVVLQANGTETVHTDSRLDDVAPTERAAYKKRLAAGHGYDAGHRDLLLALQAEQARRVNQPGGYWIAGAQPDAAYQGITTMHDRSGVSGLLIASDGVVPERHPEAKTWRDLYCEAIGLGAAVTLNRIRDAEADDPVGKRWPRSKRHDDKTLLCATVAPEGASGLPRN